jgi:hypothetical protein
MKTFFQSLLQNIASVLRERWDLALETMALRHQLAVLERSTTRPRFSPADRCILSTVWSRWQEALTIVQPDTVRRWSRHGLRYSMSWLHGQRQPGRLATAPEVRALIRQLSQANVRWGAPRIHGELAKLGVRVSRTTVAKYMARRPGPPSPTWRTCIRHHAYALVARGVYAELARRFHTLSIQVIRTLPCWLASWTTREARRSAWRDVMSLTPPSSTTSVSSLWAPGIVDRVRVPERSPPDPQRPGHYNSTPVGVPRAVEMAHVRLAASAMGRWKVSRFRRQQVPCDTTGQTSGGLWQVAS